MSYSTSFPLTENPISEANHWVNGAADGKDWGDIQTSTNLAYGTTVSGGPPYSDSIAALTGTWGTNQTACAVVSLSPSLNRNAAFYEVEVHLNWTIAAHMSTGYEFNYSTHSDGSQYAQLVKWDGLLNQFSYLNINRTSATPPPLATGNTLCASNSGGTLTFTRNNATIFTGTDTSLTGGSPGIGFYNQGGVAADNALYGFSSFNASSN